MKDHLEIRPLSAEEESARIDALKLAERLVSASSPLAVDHVQELYDVLLREHRDFVEGQIAVGIAFGELIVAKAGYEWVRVKDEYGSETALAPHGFHGACHPISMLQKRIASREELDVADLKDWTINLIEERIAGGLWARR